MALDPISRGTAELREARRANRGLYWFVGLFSAFANLLMLTGPLYMLNVYDRVLNSRSIETLIGLTVLAAYLYGMMALLDYARQRIMARAGARFQASLDKRTWGAVMQRSSDPSASHAHAGLANLESIQRLMSSPVPGAACDLPWTPIFLFGIFLFDPLLGYLAVGGGTVLILITIINQLTTKRPVAEANRQMQAAEMNAAQMRREAEMVRSMGMVGAAFERWKVLRDKSLGATIKAADLSGTFTSITKSSRLFLQSAMLGLGAYLVITAGLNPGAMIAASILLGRALAPVEQLLGQWTTVQRAQKGWADLAQLLGESPEQPERTPLPHPRAQLDVQSITVIPPGERTAALRAMSFSVPPGTAVGVIGTSGAGKSTLARALTAVWPAQAGKIRLDGAALEQYDPEKLGALIGYLPQRVQLFDGTIAENIARMSMTPDPEMVVAAAKKAAAHEMILALPDGYDTRVTAMGGRLSGGETQRIGLARAMYGDPVILVLDEPNSNLDDNGSKALNHAIRQLKSEGRTALIMAHRPAAIEECEMILVVDAGTVRAFGPKEEVLRQTVANHQDIAARRANMGPNPGSAEGPRLVTPGQGEPTNG